MAREEMRRLPNKKGDRDVRTHARQLIKNGLHIRTKADEDIQTFLADSTKTEEKNWGCFFLQQSLELTIKGLIKYYYEYYQEFHFLKGNAEILLELSEKHSELREIYDDLQALTEDAFSAEINRWEAISRYSELYVFYKNIKTANKISERICEFVRRHNYLKEDE